MAFNLNQDDSAGLQEQHDINVTPFIDIMLVLLIIFMVAAPLATVSVPVKLPSASLETTPKEDKPLYLTVRADMTLVLGESQAVTLEKLASAVKALHQAPEQVLFLRADKTLAYGDLMKVMSNLHRAEIYNVSLVALEQLEAAN